MVVVTGAAGGVGRVVTKRYADAGARLSLWELHGDRARAMIETYDAPKPIVVETDITDEASVASAIEKTQAELGPIDVLAHIAGGFAMPGPVHEGHLDVWQKMIALNATAVYITCGKVAAHMLQNDVSGSICLVAARAALKGGKSGAAYAASKSAALRVMESLSEELKDHNIRVNAISPSIIDTPANRDAMGTENADKWVTPDEIAETMLFLTSARASAVTGANLEVYKRA